MGGKLIKTSQLIISAMLKKIVFVDEFTKMLREGYFCPTTFLTRLIHFFFSLWIHIHIQASKVKLCFYVETTLDINVVLRVGFFGRFWKYEVKWCFFIVMFVDRSTSRWTDRSTCWQLTGRQNISVGKIPITPLTVDLLTFQPVNLSNTPPPSKSNQCIQIVHPFLLKIPQVPFLSVGRSWSFK